MLEAESFIVTTRKVHMLRLDDEEQADVASCVDARGLKIAGASPADSTRATPGVIRRPATAELA